MLYRRMTTHPSLLQTTVEIKEWWVIFSWNTVVTPKGKGYNMSCCLSLLVWAGFYGDTPLSLEKFATNPFCLCPCLSRNEVRDVSYDVGTVFRYQSQSPRASDWVSLNQDKSHLDRRILSRFQLLYCMYCVFLSIVQIINTLGFLSFIRNIWYCTVPRSEPSMACHCKKIGYQLAKYCIVNRSKYGSFNEFFIFLTSLLLTNRFDSHYIYRQKVIDSITL